MQRDYVILAYEKNRTEVEGGLDNIAKLCEDYMRVRDQMVFTALMASSTNDQRCEHPHVVHTD